MKGDSGKTRGLVNTQVFESFVNERSKQEDWLHFIDVNGRRLNKKAICKTCGFGRSVFMQNPNIKERFAMIEAALLAKGILKGGEDNSIPVSRSGSSRNEYVQLIKDKIAALDAEINDTEGFLDYVMGRVAEYEAEAKIIIRRRSQKKMEG
ncbi:MAG: hypothetical protein ACLP29_15720 [Dissulfurispiraceae bacterium]